MSRARLPSGTHAGRAAATRPDRVAGRFPSTDGEEASRWTRKKPWRAEPSGGVPNSRVCKEKTVCGRGAGTRKAGRTCGCLAFVVASPQPSTRARGWFGSFSPGKLGEWPRTWGLRRRRIRGTPLRRMAGRWSAAHRACPRHSARAARGLRADRRVFHRNRGQARDQRVAAAVVGLGLTTPAALDAATPSDRPSL
jgi:hypothetical protein